MTEEVYYEVLNESSDSSTQDFLFESTFRRENFKLYDGLVHSLARKLYPDFEEFIRRDFSVTYEFLRRQGERLGISLPHVETATLLNRLGAVSRGLIDKKEEVAEVLAENPLYVPWAGNVLLTYEEAGFPDNVGRDCSNNLITMYKLLKDQGKVISGQN